MKKEQELKEIYLVVIEKRKRWLKSIDECWYETCETAKEAKLFTAPAARDAVKLLADKHYVYGAKVVCSGDYNNAMTKAKKERLAGADKTQEGTPAKDTAVEQAKGPEKTAENLVLPEEIEIEKCKEGLKVRIMSVKEQDELEEQTRKLIKPISPCAFLKWEDVKNIVELADRMLDNMTAREAMKLGEEGYYRKVLEELIAQ